MNHQTLPIMFAAACITLFAALPAVSADAVLFGTLLDSRTGQLTEGGIIVIADGRIECVGTADECTSPEGVPLHDYGAAILMPGLIDTHVHLRAGYAAAFPLAGVTTVRDATSPLPAMREARSVRHAPRILMAGPMLDSSDSFLSQFGATGIAPGEGNIETAEFLITEGPEAGREAVDALAEAGVDWIKLHTRLSQEITETVISASAEHGIPVMADLGTIGTFGLKGSEVDITDAARAGVTSIEHLSGLSLAYQRRGGDPQGESIDDEILDEIAGELIAHSPALVPSLALYRQLENPSALRRDEFNGHETLEQQLGEHMRMRVGMSRQVAPLAAADRRLVEALIPRLLDEDILVAAGSDTPAAPWLYPGEAMHMELQALVEAGLPHARAIRAATADAAKLLGRDDIGRIQVGHHADIIVVACDPTSDITCLRNLEAVYLAGERVDQAALISAIQLDKAEPKE